MPNREPYHDGERRIQQRLGEEAEARRIGRGVADAIVRPAWSFVEAQPLVVLGSVSPGGATWASLVVGATGFARVVPGSEGRSVELDLARARVHPADPVLADLASDPRVGMLFIELGTRRRLRINGTARRAGERLAVAVDETYANCPKYIQRRWLRSAVDLAQARPGPVSQGTALGERERALVRSADTFFVASSHPAGGVDVSHRGGEPGFVEVADERTLGVPDYPGNHMYNTLGNFAVHPRAGLTFLDFESGRVLMATGDAEIVFDGPGRPRRERETGGTNRFWSFRVDAWRSFELPVRLAWELLDRFPSNPPPAAAGHGVPG